MHLDNKDSLEEAEDLDSLQQDHQDNKISVDNLVDFLLNNNSNNKDTDNHNMVYSNNNYRHRDSLVREQGHLFVWGHRIRISQFIGKN